MESIPVNPLANPKGIKLVCELCAKPACLQCKSCRVTYYCDSDHQALDWNGIHSKTCQLLVPLRTPVAVLGSEEERAIRHSQLHSLQLQLLQLTKTEAHKLLFEGHHDLAIPAALQALRFSMDVYGSNSIDLVPSYLLLGEASIGLKQYNQADDYLSLAKWAILKAVDCENSIRSQLHRNFGLLYSSQGLYEKALHQLALDVYYISLSKNPEDISVTGGYFHIGSVFHKQNRIDDSSAAFDTVASIWKKKLKTLATSTEKLDTAQMAEAIQMLTAIHAFRMNYASSPVSAADALMVLAQVYVIANQPEKAKDNMTKALEIFEGSLGREHSSTLEARNILRSILQVGKF